MQVMKFILGLLKFLVLNCFATSVAFGIAYFALSRLASKYWSLWILALLAAGALTSLIQLAFLQSGVSEKAKWLVSNSIANLVLPVIVPLMSYMIAIVIDALGLNLSTGAPHINFAILGLIAGSPVGGIIAATHCSLLHEGKNTKAQWATSVVIVTAIVSSIVMYGSSFLQLACLNLLPRVC